MEEEEKYKPIVIARKLFEKDYENKVCVECKCPMPSFVSINNAILLCDQCAQRHMKLGYNVSYVRNIMSDWDAYLYTYMDRGGNSRFIRLSNKYNLKDLPIEQKYNTRILEYYRLLIKSEVLADAPPFEIPYEVAKEPINNNIIYFPEFENYQIYEGNFKPEKKSKGYVDAFRFVGNGLGSMANYFGNKYQEYDMNNKIVQGGIATFKGLAAAGKFLYKLSKPIIKYASIRTVQGVGYLCKQAEFQLSDDEGDDSEEEEDEKQEKNNNNKKTNKKKKKKKKNEESKNKNEINNNENNNNQDSLCLKEGEYIFEPCIDYPTFESINRVNEANNVNNNNNNIIDNNFNINNFNENNIQNEFKPSYQNNNQIKTPDYVIPPGLESSSHENSIVGEK